jgi:hypothetical protein|uniref:Uncharacterized protein n=1 Tax=Zea mays TaxID=4577 RepID=C4J9N8_MAIZE|nr:unknown [Zea mays]
MNLLLCSAFFPYGAYLFSLQNVCSKFCSGVIGFLLCAKDGPPVNFLTPVNPIEEVEGATKAGREIRFYNSEVSFLQSIAYDFLCQYFFFDSACAALCPSMQKFILTP